MFYTITELRTLLKLSSSQLYALIDSGKLKCHRFTTGRSGGIRISQAQLDAYLRATESEGEPTPPQRPTQAPRLRNLSLD